MRFAIKVKIMIVSNRTKQLFVSVLDKGMIGSCCIRTSVGIESPSRCPVGIPYRSMSTNRCSQHRFLSSARPLPDDDLEGMSWRYDEASLVQSVKRAPFPYSNTQQSLAQLNSALSTSIPSTKINCDASNTIDYCTVEEDESNEIATNTLMQTMDKENHDYDAASIMTSNNLSESATLEEHDKYLSPSTLRYTGDAVIPITSLLRIVKPQDDIPRGVWPVFRLLVSSDRHFLLLSTFRTFLCSSMLCQ